ncbi:hypothetical protein [Streptomyces zhihengii]|uniref:hypothetical protein n=1 Tax=Streptomyces zhihengii TaxID=1818004 RepID=UPI00361F0C1E
MTGTLITLDGPGGNRYLPSTLVLQRADGLDADWLLTLNVGITVPDLAVILTATPADEGTTVPEGSSRRTFRVHPRPADAGDHPYSSPT